MKLIPLLQYKLELLLLSKELSLNENLLKLELLLLVVVVFSLPQL